MADPLPPELAVRLTEFVEKVGLLRRDMQQKGDLQKYEARIARVEQKFSALAERISEADPEMAKALRTAWQLPARSLAFRNAAHQKESSDWPTNVRGNERSRSAQEFSCPSSSSYLRG